jgi:putative PEP-CTERM system TPR-repeat lipoprotein
MASRRTVAMSPRVGAWLAAGALLSACAGPTPDELLSQSRAAIEAGELPTAEIHLKNLLQQERDHRQARELLGEVLLRRGDLVGAEQNFARALELGADSSIVELSLLRALVGQAKFAEALELIETRGLPRSASDTGEVAVLQAAAYRGLDQAERAIEVYRAALAIDPAALDVRTDLASTLLALGRADEARGLITAVLSDEPNYTPALLLRGGLEAAAVQYAAAEATLQQVVNLEQVAAAPTQRYTLAMAQLIEVQIALGKLDAAAANADAFLARGGRNLFARYSKALVEVEQGNLTGAEQRLEALVAEAPQFWPSHRLLGVINTRQDQLGQATMYLRTAVTNNPSDAAARVQLAELYVRQGDLDAARTLMEGSPVAESEGLFLAFAGSVSQRAGLQEQAESLFERSEQQAPGNLQELLGLSRLYTSAGEFERAIRVLQSSALEDEQSQLLSDYLLTLIHIRQGNLEAADAAAQRLEKRGQTAIVANLRGMVALLRGDAARARGLFARALEIEPRNVVAMVNLARVAVLENDGGSAEQYLRRALEIDPAQPETLAGLTQLAAARGDFAAANSLLARMPESAARMRLEGELFAREGRFDEASQVFARLFTLQPSEALALRAYETARRAGRVDADAQLRQWHADHPDDPATNFALANATLERGELEEATRRYEAVIARRANDPVTLNNLAWLYGARNDPRAIETGERAITAAPNNPSIADTLGWLYVQDGDAARALPLLTRAAEALPDQREVSYHWAVALADTGDTAKAIEILERLTSDGQEFDSRAEAVRRLSDLRRRTP